MTKKSNSNLKRITGLLILMIGFGVVSSFAQIPRYYKEASKNNNGNIIAVDFLFGAHDPAADLSDRFGGHLSTGLGFDYITAKDWIIGGQWNFYFGSKVKEDVIASLRSSDGLIFGNNQNLAEVLLRQRGLYIGGHLGKIFRLKESSRSGIRVTLGAGIFQHKVRIQDDPVVDVPQLDKNYKKGYDRLTNGLGLTQFIGYQHLGRMRRANFFIGLELTEGFTQNRRALNYDSRLEENDMRFDMAYGIRVGWQLPFYMGENAEEIRY